MKEKQFAGPVQEFPWDDIETAAEKDNGACPTDDVKQDPLHPNVSLPEVCNLIDQMVMDIQHLELEIVRTRYKLSFHLPAPYDKYMRMEIFSGMGSRYSGDPVYDEYLSFRGYDDAIDTPFHVKRMQRLAEGYDDYPDLYP